MLEYYAGAMKGEEHITINCPCCGARLFIDRETGGLLRHEEPAREKGSMDDLVSKYRQKQSGMGGAFRKAIEEEEKRKRLLQKKFKDSSRNIDKLADPKKPFDLD